MSANRGSQKINGWENTVYTIKVARCPNGEVQLIKLIRTEDGATKSMTLLEAEETVMTLIEDPSGWEPQRG